MIETARVSSIYRYPVKGLSPQKLESVDLVAGEALPWDRAYAMENGPAPFDPRNPAFLPKTHFLMLMRNERLAELETDFNETSQTLTIRHNSNEMVKGELNSPEGRARVEEFMAGFMQDALKGPPSILSAPGHSFSDVATKCVHLVNLASLRELETKTQRTLDPLRFRANIYFEANTAWAEKGWIGKMLRIGNTVLEVFKETTRCAAIDVDPATAKRSTALGKTLLQNYDHTHFGIYASVTQGGTIQQGDIMHVINGQSE